MTQKKDTGGAAGKHDGTQLALRKPHVLVFWRSVLSQFRRNLGLTWASQCLTFCAVALSVLIFSFFYLIYFNMNLAAVHLGQDLRLVVYLEQEPDAATQESLRKKIQMYEQVRKIDFVSRRQAFERFAARLGEASDILADMPKDFLPPSIEVYPYQSIDMLARMATFSDYLQKLPGVMKVRYGREWLDRFFNFMQLLQVVVILSGLLLILTSTFMVGGTIRQGILSRRDELEVLRLLGAGNGYIRTPFFIEGLLQGLCGALAGLGALYVIFLWTKSRFVGPEMFRRFELQFFPAAVVAAIVLASVLLCTLGGISSMRKLLRV
jgi:cell division transport system permease protein